MNELILRHFLGKTPLPFTIRLLPRRPRGLLLCSPLSRDDDDCVLCTYTRQGPVATSAGSVSVCTLLGRIRIRERANFHSLLSCTHTPLALSFRSSNGSPFPFPPLPRAQKEQTALRSTTQDCLGQKKQQGMGSYKLPLQYAHGLNEGEGNNWARWRGEPHLVFALCSRIAPSQGGERKRGPREDGKDSIFFSRNLILMLPGAPALVERGGRCLCRW